LNRNLSGQFETIVALFAAIKLQMKQVPLLTDSLKGRAPAAVAFYRKFNTFQGRALLHGTARNKLNEARTTLFHGIPLRINCNPTEAAYDKQTHSVPSRNNWIH
jgi:hypothetical protein